MIDEKNEKDEKKNNVRKETINIKGMTCRSCVNNIESEVGEMPGIKNVKVDLANDKALVEFDSSKISLAEIKSKINELGYKTDKENLNNRKKTIIQGITYGLIPHIGCIAFIIGSILGVTMLMQFFKPLLMNRYFFHYLLLLSFAFATISAAVYLRKNQLLSVKGAKKKWKYLSIMYGSTIGINLVLFMLIFPMLANVGSASSSEVLASGANTLLGLEVDIPCPGHAPLISEELKTISGVENVQYSFPNKFDVSYNSGKTSKEEILLLDVFNEYPATELSESPLNADLIENAAASSPATIATSPQKSSCGCGGCSSKSVSGAVTGAATCH